ncbi:MAG: imidazolonepropionase-like domain-containing protein, partial [Caldilineaceae bacterium]
MTPTKEHVDLLIIGAAQVVTCASPGGPKRRAALADVGLIANGAVAVEAGRIVAVGPTRVLQARYVAKQTINADGRVVCPGLVDCHTHTLFAGSRVDEWERKLQGVPYLEILAAGGGILNTVQATRAARKEKLAAEGKQRLARMLAHGSTTVEIKSGYGLSTESELRLLATMGQLAVEQPVRIVPTLLAAHAVPPESAGDANGYITQIIETLLPSAAAWYSDSPFALDGSAPVPFFNDIFVEAAAFAPAQAERLL